MSPCLPLPCLAYWRSKHTLTCPLLHACLLAAILKQLFGKYGPPPSVAHDSGINRGNANANLNSSRSASGVGSGSGTASGEGSSTIRSRSDSDAGSPRIGAGTATAGRGRPGVDGGALVTALDEASASAAVASAVIGAPPDAPFTATQVATVREPNIPKLEAFRDAAKRGDTTAFAMLVAETCSDAAGVALHYCDACMETVLKERSREYVAAAEERDTVIGFANDTVSRVAADPILGPLLEDAGDVESPVSLAALAPTEPDADAHGGIPTHHDDVASASAPPATSPSSNAAWTALGMYQRASSHLLAEVRTEEDALLEEIQQLRRRSAAAASEMRRLQLAEAQIDALEARVWAEHREVARALYAGRQRMYSLQLRNLR